MWWVIKTADWLDAVAVTATVATVYWVVNWRVAALVAVVILAIFTGVEFLVIRPAVRRELIEMEAEE